MAIKTFHETKISMPDKDGYFYIKNESYKQDYLNFSGSGSYTTSIEFSKDKVNWRSLQNINSFNVYPGEKIYFRSTNGWFNYSGGGKRFSPAFICSIGGNLATLIDYTDKDNVTTIPDGCFKEFLSGVPKLISIDNLSFGNITTIGEYSCYRMFLGVSAEGFVPDLSKITTVDVGGMREMFNGSKVSGNCDLSAVTTVGDEGFYNMFQNTNIESADIGGLTTIGNSGCFAIFYNCHNLGEVKAPNVSTWETSKMSNWLYRAGELISGTKTVYCPTGVTIPTDDNSGIPRGWTRVDY